MGLRQDFAVYKVHLHIYLGKSLRLSMETGGCCLHRRLQCSAQEQYTNCDGRAFFTSTSTFVTFGSPVCVGCCDVHRVLAFIERFLGFYGTKTRNGHHRTLSLHKWIMYDLFPEAIPTHNPHSMLCISSKFASQLASII